MDRLTERKWVSDKKEPPACPCCGSNRISLRHLMRGAQMGCDVCGVSSGVKPSVTMAVGAWEKRANTRLQPTWLPVSVRRWLLNLIWKVRPPEKGG
jgi:transcription elongation factor Elf1